MKFSRFQKIFIISCAMWAIYEIARIYFIMPLPGSQELNNLQLAYFLHTNRWLFRIIFAILILVCTYETLKFHQYLSSIFLCILGIILYYTNFEMPADQMFKQPNQLVFSNSLDNKVDGDRIIMGVQYNNLSKAYPMQFLAYHHFIIDSFGDKELMITYCTVCRTGRVYETFINDQREKFRLVGMDHFNAMLEDKSTGSWWRQSTGDAVTGPRKGQQLKEYPYSQMTLSKWLEKYPESLIFQGDHDFISEYDSLSNYESGKRKGKLTKRDSLSWKDKSWVIGIKSGKFARAYDWNELVKKGILRDEFNNMPIILIYSPVSKNFAAYKVNNIDNHFEFTKDTINTNIHRYDFFGKCLDSTGQDLTAIQSYQEYWHSWKTFQPNTDIFIQKD
ncbi:MAG: DUF3179 domain-containing protein [Saprospiraceae bacterium]|nr:DUF3179 domain-containing protein [Saprospiraceae bacterium]HRG33436.1 DUF3179 domain-containing (seleno)protein [Saprospiraceae bacterium]